MKLALITALALQGALLAADKPAWPHFRGPRFDNTFPGEKPPLDFGPEKNLLWKTAISSGQSSPIIAGDRLFVTGFDGKDSLETIALSRKDGSVLWRHAEKPAEIETYFLRLGSPAAPSCATDGERVVSYFGSAGVICHDVEGKELWRVPMPLPQTKDGFGTGSSPIIHEGVVYLIRDEDGPGQGLYALDVKTGKEIWKRKRDGFRVSFGSAVIWDDSVVVIGDLRVKGYDLRTGEDKWIVHGLAAYPCTTPAPGSDGNLYVAVWSNGSSNEPNLPTWEQISGMLDKDKDGKLSPKDCEGSFLADFFTVQDRDKNGFIEQAEWQAGLDFMSKGRNVVLAIRPGGKGDITKTHVLWENDKGAPYVASPLYYDGRLYLIKDGGLMTVYEAATGKLLTNRERLGVQGDFYMSPIAVDGRILVASQPGIVVTIQPGDTPKVLATTDLAEPLSASPAVAGDTLYIRTREHVWAFGMK